MRALRTIPVMDDFARDMAEVCPDALFLNYTNPMAMLTGYMLRYTPIQTVGLCHSVQVCSETLLKEVGMEDKLEGRKELIAGINHMGWLLELKDKNGVDLYPEIKSTHWGKMEILNLRIRYALTTFEILDTTALNRVNTMQSTMDFILRTSIQS